MTRDLPAWLHAVRQGVAAAGPSAGAFAQHVHVLTTTASTNDDVARAALVGAPQGHTVIAAEQTAGRGRRGAAWHSPAAHGLYLSTLLRPDRWPATRRKYNVPAASLITLMAGVAVASAIADASGARVELKWPNDVMVPAAARPVAAPGASAGQADAASRGPAWRKLAGILAEGASDGRALRTVVLGIGLNVYRSAAPPEVASRMVALDELVGDREPTDPLALVRPLVSALLARLAAGVEQLSSGRVDEVRQRWLTLAPSVEGTVVRWHQQGRSRLGRAQGIDDAGALRVRIEGDGEVTVHGGEVEWFIEEDAHDA